MKSIFERFNEFRKSRIFILFCCIVVLFSVLVAKLFYLQIIHGEQSQQDLKTSIMRTLTIPASRGNIFDRYGRPLATNQVAFSVKIDDSIKVSLNDKAHILTTLVEKLEQDEQISDDNLPISKTKPYYFTFNGDENAEKNWKTSIGIKKNNLDISADETMDFLMDKYNISPDTPEKTKRNIIDLNINLNDKNLMLISLVKILMDNGENIVDELPFSKTTPHALLFDNNSEKENNWKESIYIKKENLNMTDEECYNYLLDYFEIPKSLSPELARNVAALRYSLFLERYRKYQPVTVALNINDKTVASLEENQNSFPGVTIDTDSLRKYPEGEYFSHILGYIRKISDTEYERFKQYKTSDGVQIYSNSDIVGKSGIEKVQELKLNGEDGEMLVEVDNVGRRINTIETKQPISGSDIFLTLDKTLQNSAYDFLEEELTNVLIKKLTSSSKIEMPITLKQLFTSMVDTNSIPLRKIFTSTEGEQYNLKQLVLNENPEFKLSTDEDMKYAKEIISTAIEKGVVSSKQMVLVLYEQGKISADEDYLNRIKSGRISPLTVILQKLESKELRPSDTNLDPCTGSVVVSDVNSGDVLALVTYPSYDNNELVNNFNNQYYNDLLLDLTTPLVNRALSQSKAPGSTFKMVSAIALLEEGIITPRTTVHDKGTFTTAGLPYARCWIGGGSGSHGSVNVSMALEVSCNYFFYENLYRLSHRSDDSLDGITTLNGYMADFGLSSPTGIELGEADPLIASPENKERIIKMQNPDATSSQTRWKDGDTIRAAIGQSVNSYTPAQMNKYIATLANGGTRYKMHIINKIADSNGNLTEKSEPEVENIMNIKEENLHAVYEGMRLVTEGSSGTLRTVFKDFPISVATKSGTAQEDLSRSSHAWFVGFAPYDDPQISVTVMMPFGDFPGAPSAVVGKNIIGKYMGLNYEPENTYMDNVLAK